MKLMLIIYTDQRPKLLSLREILNSHWQKQHNDGRESTNYMHLKISLFCSYHFLI